MTAKNNDFEMFNTLEAHEDFEIWAQNVIDQMKSMLDRDKESIALLTNYEYVLEVTDENRELFNNLQKERGVIDQDTFDAEREQFYNDVGRFPVRYCAICFNFIGNDEGLIKKHMNFSIHENSFNKYFKSYAYQKTLSLSTSVFQAALYCYETFLAWLEKKVNLYS